MSEQKENSAEAIQKRAMKYFSHFNNAQINVTYLLQLMA
jgi:hypothetical protein